MPRRVLIGVVVALLAVAAFSAVGTMAYRAGLAQGLTDPGGAAAHDGARAYYAHPMWFHGPFWFGGFLFPLLLVFLLFALFRRPYWGRGCGYGHWRSGPPDSFDEWHRRAHESMTPPAGQA